MDIHVKSGIVFMVDRNTMMFGLQEDSGAYNYQAMYCFPEEMRATVRIGDEVDTWYDSNIGRRKARVIGRGLA